MIGIRTCIRRRKIAKEYLAQYQTFPMLNVSKDEIKKANDSIFMIEKDINCKKGELTSNVDTSSNCSSENNVFRDANCYVLYLFGKAFQSSIAWTQSVLHCSHCRVGENQFSAFIVTKDMWLTSWYKSLLKYTNNDYI